MTERGIALGAFDLIRPVAEGGMAQVWLARHRQQGIPVAVKILVGRSALNPGFRARFSSEVQAVAALDHPGVVMVLDHGQIPAEAAERAPRIIAGAPWLAMEYISGGTLADGMTTLPWRTVRTIADALLEALGHAHARDVVHRDLKPTNILMAQAGDQRPGLRLTDFGIAWAGAAELEADGKVVGTPSYMAPEQIAGQWRDFGPWTDLYAFGCLMWWLTTGATPFGSRKDVTDILLAHLHDDPPAYEPRMAVPEGFEEWVRRLLAKPWRDRFPFAADAAASLDALGAPGSAARLLPEDAPTIPLGDFDPTSAPTQPRTYDEAWRRSIEHSNIHTAPISRSASRPGIAPIPDDWRQPSAAATPTPLVGAGLSLYGLRQVPFTGREGERDQLWAELKRVADTGRARAVLIRGPAGTGKSRLVEWLVRRGSELGALRWCKATFGREKMPDEAMRQMANDWFQTHGLPRDEIRERVEAFLEQFGGLDDDELEVLTEVLRPATDEQRQKGLQAVRLTRPREYYQGTINAMYRVTQDRPLIAWFDDVQWGLHGLRTTIQVLRSQEERPFAGLMVCTLRDESLDPASDEAKYLERLREMPGCTEISLGPLSSDEHRQLVRGLLGLEDELADRVEERTRGNPLFAVQLVGAWVHDGTLQVGPRGFRLQQGASVELPDDLHGMWSAQLAHALREYPEEAQRYLEVAACLGHEVDGEEWGNVCDDPEGHFRGRLFATEDRLRGQLVDRLVVLHLATGTPRRWAFVHGMLQESLLRTAAEAGRLRDHHVSCALMLEQRSGELATAERLGRHRVEAGQPERAIEPLLLGVEYRLKTSGAEPARRLLGQVAEVMSELGVPERDPRWGRVWTLQATVAAELEETSEALISARQARASAQVHAWGEVGRMAMLTEARLLLELGRVPEATAVFERLEVESRASEDAGRRAAALVGLAELARRRKDHEAAIQLQDKALHVFAEALQAEEAAGRARREGLSLDYARALTRRGQWAQASGRGGDAARYYSEALRWFEAVGAGLGSAECLDRLGRLAAASGRFPQAEQLFGRALSRYESLAAERAFSCRMRLVQCVMRRSRESAWPIVAKIQPLLARLQPPARRSVGRGLHLLRASLESNPRQFDRAVQEVAASVPPLVRASDAVGGTMLAWLVQLAGEAWQVQGDDGRAIATLRGAIQIWRTLRRSDRVAYVERLISS